MSIFNIIKYDNHSDKYVNTRWIKLLVIYLTFARHWQSLTILLFPSHKENTSVCLYVYSILHSVYVITNLIIIYRIIYRCHGLTVSCKIIAIYIVQTFWLRFLKIIKFKVQQSKWTQKMMQLTDYSCASNIPIISDN